MNSKEAIEALATRHCLNIDELQAWGETVEQRADYRRFLGLEKLDTDDPRFVPFDGLCFSFVANWIEWASQQGDPDFVRRTVARLYPEATGSTDTIVLSEHVHQLSELGESAAKLVNGMMDDLHNRIITAISTGTLGLYDDLMRAVDISNALSSVDAGAWGDTVSGEARAQAGDHNTRKSSGGETPVVDWKAKARELAQTIGTERYRIGEREITARNVCEAVATRLEALDNGKYWGLRGARSASNVRSALKGWTFRIPENVD